MYSHGKPTEDDYSTGTLIWIRMPIGLLSAAVFLFGPYTWIRAIGLILGLCMIFLPRKIVDGIGCAIYVIGAVFVIGSILLHGA